MILDSYDAVRDQIDSAVLEKFGIEGAGTKPVSEMSRRHVMIGKTGPEGYRHGWVYVGSGDAGHDEKIHDHLAAAHGEGQVAHIHTASDEELMQRHDKLHSELPADANNHQHPVISHKIPDELHEFQTAMAMPSESWAGMPSGGHGSLSRFNQTGKSMLLESDYEAAKRQILAAKIDGILAGASQFTSVMEADVRKVGPKGYEHGWVKVGVPGLAQRGFGTVFGQTGKTVEETGVAGAHVGRGGMGPHGTTHVVTVEAPHATRSMDSKYHVEVTRLNPKTGGESGAGKASRTTHDTAEEALARVDQLIAKHSNVHAYDDLG